MLCGRNENKRSSNGTLCAVPTAGNFSFFLRIFLLEISVNLNSSKLTVFSLFKIYGKENIRFFVNAIFVLILLIAEIIN